MPGQITSNRRCIEFPTPAFYRQASGIFGAFCRGMKLPASMRRAVRRIDCASANVRKGLDSRHLSALTPRQECADTGLSRSQEYNPLAQGSALGPPPREDPAVAVSGD